MSKPECGCVHVTSKRIAELEAERAELNSPVQLSEWQKMEQQLAELREAAQAVVDDATETEFMTEDGLIKFSVADIRLIDALAEGLDREG